MAHHEVDQAIYTSEKNYKRRGYQLVARSTGVNSDIAREISQWSPSHGAILSTERNAHCVSFFPVTPDKIAIGRTVYGLPEYSGRGGLQVYTHYLIVKREHLAGFDNDAWKLWTVARSQGLMQWAPRQDSSLPTLSLIDHWALVDAPQRHFDRSELVSSVRDSLASGRRVAVIDPERPFELLKHIFAAVAPESRLDVSFGVGLKPSVERPFKLQIIPKVDLDIRTTLSSEQVAIVQNDRLCQLAIQ